MRTFLLFLFVGSLLLFNTSFTQNTNKFSSLLSKNDIKLETLVSSTNATDSIIALAVSQINPDSIGYFIQKLQDFGTRYALAPNHHQVAEWIKNEFERLGNITAELDSFLVDSVWMFNVVATLQGRITPENYVIIGGHYDSRSEINPMITAPGADDNASGTAAVLELARVISSMNYVPDVTIKFIAFDAEETYIISGSSHYAQKAVEENMNIKIMINNDMISYNEHNIEESKAKVYYGSLLQIKNLSEIYFQIFTLLTPVFSPETMGDDTPFKWVGYKTLGFQEYNFNPYYHTPEETIDKLNMDYCAEIVKINCAVLLKVSEMPDEVKNLIADDVGDGSTVKLSWKSNIESDVIGYNVSVGLSEGNYDTTFFTADTISIVSGLQEGSEHYFGVSAVDEYGNESFVFENHIVPHSIPLTPQNFVDHPQWHKVIFNWSSNKELDLIGYNLYRSESTNSNYIKINTSINTDTTFTDDNMVLGKYYYYILKAVDSDLNESIASNVLRSMAVSIDKGILLVDETKNGTGSLFDPTDEQVDQFYNNILSDFYHNNYDVDINGELKLADIGAYSTIVWNGNDYMGHISALNAVGAIKDYLDFGGNLLFTGFSASKSFKGSIGISNSFEAGDFIFDYLKIDSSTNKPSTLFIRAIPKIPLYNFINVDSSKSSLATNYHIKKVEAISSNNEGTEIYAYNTNYDSTTSQGSMQGLPVGVEYIGNDYKTVILNIPLYYMNKEQSRALIIYILQNKFNEVTEIENENIKVIPSDYVLFQNYPNPFNPGTTIKYSIASPNLSKGEALVKVSMIVYDILGNEVVTLVNKEQAPGNYEVSFDASALSSGVYLYTIKAGSFVQTKKMLLMK
jgi:hypothetical protein